MKAAILVTLLILPNCTDANRRATDPLTSARSGNPPTWATRLYPITGVEITVPPKLCLEIDSPGELAVGFRGLSPVSTLDDTLCLVEIRMQRQHGRDAPIEDASQLRAWADAEHLETSRFTEGRTVYLRRDVPCEGGDELRILATVHGPGTPDIAAGDDETAAARAVNSIVCKPRRQTGKK